MERPVFRAMDIVNRLTWAFAVGVCVGMAGVVLFAVSVVVGAMLWGGG